jgi:hypothetical protein
MRGPAAAALILCAGRTQAGASSLRLAVVTTRAAPLPDDVGCRSLAVASHLDSSQGDSLHGAIPDTPIDNLRGFTSRGNTVVWAATVIRLISTPASNRTKRRPNSGDQAPGAFYQFHMNRQSLKAEKAGGRGDRASLEKPSLKAGWQRRLRPQGREGAGRRGVQIGRAPTGALKGRTRILRAESVAGEQLLRL